MNRSIGKFVMAAAWIAILAIAFATLTRVGFVYDIYFKLAPILMRPEIKTYAHAVHIMAFLVLGALFSFAYPERTLLLCCLVPGVAAILEILQNLTPDRHGTLVDAMEKMAGGLAGIVMVRAFARIARARRSTSTGTD